MSKNLPYSRGDRIADEIYMMINESLVMRIADPRLVNVRITRVRMTKDLRIAYVYFHMYDTTDELKLSAASGLESAKGFLKREIGSALALKFVPDLKFFFDESIELCEKIDALSGGR
jgi:ribosome-binding factor A